MTRHDSQGKMPHDDEASRIACAEVELHSCLHQKGVARPVAELAATMERAMGIEPT